MATFSHIHQLAQDGNIRAQIAVAISNEAKYAIQQSADPDTRSWATWVVPSADQEARSWQLVVCGDPAISDAVEVRDEDVAAAVTALVPTMVQRYKQTIVTAP